MLRQVFLIEMFFSKPFLSCIPTVSIVKVAEMVRPCQPSMLISPEICSLCHVLTAFQLWSSHEIMNIEITEGELNWILKIKEVVQISRKVSNTRNGWLESLSCKAYCRQKTWVQDVCFFELAAVDVFNLWKRKIETQCFCHLESSNLFCPNVYSFDVIIFAQKDATVGCLNFLMERWENQ